MQLYTEVRDVSFQEIVNRFTCSCIFICLLHFKFGISSLHFLQEGRFWFYACAIMPSTGNWDFKTPTIDCTKQVFVQFLILWFGFGNSWWRNLTGQCLLTPTVGKRSELLTSRVWLRAEQWMMNGCLPDQNNSAFVFRKSEGPVKISWAGPECPESPE